MFGEIKTIAVMSFSLGIMSISRVADKISLPMPADNISFEISKKIRA